MRHFPIFLDLRGRHVVVSGAGQTALAKLRLLMKSEARISVFGPDPDPQVQALAEAGRIRLLTRPLAHGDALCAALVYGANADAVLDARARAIGKASGALVNIVDDLSSDFITPAIVDRDPVTVAIGTEGAAPVVARHIKARLEEMLPAGLGALVRIGQGFRARVAHLDSKARRVFWNRFYFGTGPRAQSGGRAQSELERLLAEGIAPQQGRVHLVGAGPGDPELMTIKARRLLHDADVVIHDRLVPQPVLELARREALVVEVGKQGFGPAWKQDDINALMVRHARAGASVVRLKSGDPGVFGRLDDELDALDAAGVAWDIVPGITAASAAVAGLGQSFTRRGRNSDFRLLTGHDMKGFADHDWRTLARPGTCAGIYMGTRAAAFLRGRLLMHGAAPDTPVTAVENAARPDERVIATRLIDLPEALLDAAPLGPVVLLLGLAPRSAAPLPEVSPAGLSLQEAL